LTAAQKHCHSLAVNTGDGTIEVAKVRSPSLSNRMVHSAHGVIHLTEPASASSLGFFDSSLMFEDRMPHLYNPVNTILYTSFLISVNTRPNQ